VSDGGTNHRVLRFSPPLTNGQAADLVLGQPDLESGGTCNPGGVCGPEHLAIGPDQALYVASRAAAQVVRFPSPQTTGQTSDLALSPDGEIFGVAFDPSGNLFVSGSSQVFRFRQPVTSGQQADLVFGQANPVGLCPLAPSDELRPINASTFCAPLSIAVDFRGDVFVADAWGRVLRFDQPSNGTQPPTGTRSVGVP
jgi:hypothetical protein